MAGTAGDTLTGTAAGEPRPLNELEQELIKAKATTTEIEAKFIELTRQSTLPNDRPAKISQRLADIKDQEEKLQQPRMRYRWPRIRRR